MAKIRIHEIAKELGYDSKEIIEKANELGLGIKTASNAVEPEIAAAIYEYIQTREIPEAFKKNIKTPTAKKPKKENIKEQEKLNESEKKEPKKEEKLKQEVKKEELKIEKENAKEEEKQV
ncbi:translation initiation factor IF-2 N-terminal domain-containing protein, partial [Campylobacter jejuni]|uniref:translation initiation factor IF-2 N-terminal domain-containing protein n=1 Tax=Campylobacter jejuni TaxID=197 RepID=UPI0022421173